MSDAVTVAVITAITQTIGLVLAHIANKRSRRKSTKAIHDKLDAIGLAHETTVSACNSVVAALSTQVSRLQNKRTRNEPEHDDTQR